MIGKLKCLIGWHNWSWKWDGKPIQLNSTPPNHAKCKICGKVYRVTKFRKKPDMLDAWQFTKNNFRDGVPKIFKHESVYLWSQYGGDIIGGEIETPNGKCAISENDWLVKNINGEFYSCKPDIFEAEITS